MPPTLRSGAFYPERVVIDQGVKKEGWGRNVDHGDTLEKIGNEVVAMRAG